MARRQGGTLSGFTPLSTPNAPTDLSVSTSIGSASVSFTAPTDTGDGAVTSFIVTAIDESTGASSGFTASAPPITISPGVGTFKIRAQAINGFGPGRLTEFNAGNQINFLGAKLYAWGYNANGQLGLSNTTNRSTPAQVGSLTTWEQVSGGSSHTAAIRADGTFWAWGANSDGRLGDGTIVGKSSPVQIGSLTNWAQVSAGYSFTAAVKTDGTIWAWGSGQYGQLGTRSTVSRSSPVQIGRRTNWAQVSAGGSQTCAAVKTDGTLWAWGRNRFGAVGDGTYTFRSSPVQVGALTNWAQVATMAEACTAVTTEGQLYAWGYNANGQLGLSDTSNRNSPVQVGALTNWSQISTFKSSHTAAVKTDGTLWAWGRNYRGQLGDSSSTDRSSPVQIGALTNWAKVSGGFEFTAALKTEGTLWAWGFNSSGQLGQNNRTNRNSPVQTGSLTTWVQVSAGGIHTTALLGVI